MYFISPLAMCHIIISSTIIKQKNAKLSKTKAYILCIKAPT